MTDRLVYRIPEVCSMLGISRATLYRRAATGEIQIHKLGGISVIKKVVLDKLLDSLPDPRREPQLSVSCGDPSRDAMRHCGKPTFTAS